VILRSLEMSCSEELYNLTLLTFYLRLSKQEAFKDGQTNNETETGTLIIFISLIFTARCIIVHGVILRLHVVRPSVCDVGRSGPHRSEILELIALITFALRSPKCHPPTYREHREICWRIEVGWGKSGVLEEHKSDNIYETRKVREKVTMEAYRNSPMLFRTVPSPTPYGLLFPKIGGS